MAKKNGNGHSEQQATTLAVPQQLTTAMEVAGYDDGGNPLSDVVRLHMHSGSNEDQARWPEAKAGDWIDGLDGTNYGQCIRFVPLAAFMSWSAWEQGSKIPLYSTTNKADVPADDLKWGLNSEKPKAVEAFNYIGLVEGQQFVYRLQLKRTGFKVGETIKKLQQRRDMQRSGPGVYILTSDPAKNGAGQTYRQVKVTPGGSPDMATLDIAIKAVQAIGSLKVKAQHAAVVEDTGGGEAGNDPDAPF